MNRMLRLIVIALSAALGITIGFAVLQLPEAPVRLAPQVGAEIGNSGVEHPVTAVLLNFRGYDTFLEIAVLLLALIGVLTATGEQRTGGVRVSGTPQAVLQSIARALTPLMVVVAGYLLWAGAHQAGGAFQAGAVLASCGVLLYLAGVIPAWTAPDLLLRAGLGSGFLVFLAVAIFPLFTTGASGGNLLGYPRQYAGMLILLIEAALTISIGLILAGLFLWLPDEHEEAEE